jgi:hypothetical protein
MTDRLPDEGELARAKEVIRGEIPVISEPPDTHVKLFRGLFWNGKWEDEARVKELTGADEEGIARMMTGASPQAYINAVLAYGVSQVGHYEVEKMPLPDRTSTIDMLLIGEKELLFLNVLRVSFGDQRTTTVQCQVCEAMSEVDFSITEDIPVRSLEDPHRPTYDYEARNGSRIEYRLVTGADDAEAQRRPNLSIPEANTIILSRVIDNVDGEMVVDPLGFARKMGAQDRRGLMRALQEHQPGPYFEEVKLPCTKCGAESLFRPSWADLL